MPRSTYVALIVALATGGALATSVVVVAQSPSEAPATAISAVQSAPAPAAVAVPIPQAEAVNVATAISADPHTMVGVGSCAASGCHGGSKPLPGVGPYDNLSWRSSYVVWATSDPHARAYQTLSSSAAAAIVRKLDRLPADRKVTPHLDRRCTTCHASSDPTDPAVGSFAADGIGCESCHGGAKDWLGKHFLVRTSGPDVSPTEVREAKLRLQELGMVDTDDLAVQAKTCVGCHVGDRSGRGGVRDMNHDMIAAGHPALNFEFAAYKARMPKHWSEPTDPAARALRERRTWLTGQSVALAAAIGLSADRAEASLNVDPKKPHAPWPEFSEFACYRCHHALRSGATADATAQQQLALDRKKADKRSVGEELWGTWNVWHLSQQPVMLAPEAWKQTSEVAQRASKPFMTDAELGRLIETLKAQEGAYGGMSLLYGHVPPVGEQDPIAVRYPTLSADIANNAVAGALTWDEATQAYLGCVAMYRARRAELGKPLDQADDAEGAILKQLYQALRFDQPGDRQFNSPANYDRAAVKALFEKLAAAAKGGA